MEIPAIIFNPTGQAVFSIVMQAAVGLVLFYLEVTGKFNIPYSKFRKGGTLNPRLAMVLIYFSPIPVYIFWYLNSVSPASNYHAFLLGAFIFHFGKRCLEAIFLHKYSKPMSWAPVLIVGFLYANVAGLAGMLQGTIPPPVGSQIAKSMLFAAGALIFAAGEILNFYHHLLLARLRTGSDTAYVVPRGGLFEYTASPHYLGEIIAWLGYAISSRFLSMYGICFIFICYLTARAIRTAKWYRENVPGYPADRKAIVPFLL